MTTTFDAALDEIWRATPPHRLTVADSAVAALTNHDVQQLTVWANEAGLVRAENDDPQRANPETLVESIAVGSPVLLVVAQFARDHLDSVMIGLQEGREPILAAKAEELGLPEESLWHLLETSRLVLG